MKSLLLLMGLATYPLLAAADSPPPPQTIVVVGCKVDDLTGQPGRQDPDLAARGWRDLEWHYDRGNELECKREEIPLTDSVAMVAPEVNQLHPDFSSYAQCAAVAMQYSPTWERANQGWAVAAVGCPTKIVNDSGTVIGWHLPECPSWLKCRFSGSEI